jgi:hypothetical protein
VKTSPLVHLEKEKKTHAKRHIQKEEGEKGKKKNNNKYM